VNGTVPEFNLKGIQWIERNQLCLGSDDDIVLEMKLLKFVSYFNTDNTCRNEAKSYISKYARRLHSIDPACRESHGFFFQFSKYRTF